MFNLLDHPDIDYIMKNGHPRGYEPTTYFCDECGEELGDDIFEDDVHEYLCAKCLLKLYEKRW